MSVVMKLNPKRAIGVAVAVVALGAILASANPASATSASPMFSGPTQGGNEVSGEVPETTFTEVNVGVAAGWMMAVDNDGYAYSWGLNSTGQLGDATANPRSVPGPVVSEPGVRFASVATGHAFTVALSTDGNLYSWGSNESGTLGDGTQVDRWSPGRVHTPEGVTFTDIAAGNSYVLALGTDGNTYAWGDNSGGQLGVGDTLSRFLPTVVPRPEGVTFTQVDAGLRHSLALGSDGKVYAWGRNWDGQLGTGSGDSSEVPVAAATPDGVSFAQVSASAQHSLAVTSDGKVYAWGYGPGVIGDGSSGEVRNTPVQTHMPEDAIVVGVSAGGYHSVALTGNGAVYVWGHNGGSTLGTGSTDAVVTTPALVPADIAFTHIDAGYSQTAAVGEDGRVYTWGVSDFGSLGDGSWVTRTAPGPILSASELVGVSFGNTAVDDVSVVDRTWTATAPPGCGVFDVSLTYTQSGVEHTKVIPDGLEQGTLPQVTTQPEQRGEAVDGVVSIFAEAEGDDEPTVRWESAASAAGPWTVVADASETTISVDQADPTWVRAVFTNCRGEAVSDAFEVPADGSSGAGSDSGSSGSASASSSDSGSSGSASASGSDSGSSGSDADADAGAASDAVTTTGAEADDRDGWLARTGGFGLLPWVVFGGLAVAGGVYVAWRGRRLAGSALNTHE